MMAGAGGCMHDNARQAPASAYLGVLAVVADADDGRLGRLNDFDQLRVTAAVPAR